MSDYTDIDASSLSAGEKAYYKEHAKITTFGKTGDNDAVNSNYNVPLSEIAGSALPPYDQSTSSDEGKVLVVKDMAASWKQYPNSDNYNTPISGGIFASGEFKPIKLHYDNTLTLVTDAEHPQYNKNLSVAHPVPDPGTNLHRGDVLMVDSSSDDIVWAQAPGGGGGYEPGTDSALVTSGSYIYVHKDGKTVKTNVNDELVVNYGDGLHYDDISDKLVVDCYDSGGLAFESYSTGKALKVKGGDGIDVGSSGVKISTVGANDGDVLTYNGTTHKVGWATGGGGGGGSSSYTVTTLSGPFPLNEYHQNVITLPDNHKIYNITNLYNDDYSDVCIVPPTVSGNEAIDVYVNIEIPSSDETYYYVFVKDLQRMKDAVTEGYSSTSYGNPIFIHIVYKYYTILHTSDE